MNNLTDAIQTTLKYGLPGCVALALVLMQSARIVGGLFDLAALLWRYIAPVWRPAYLARVGVLSLLLWAVSGLLHDTLEEIECRYLQPVYITNRIDNEHAAALYEAQIRKHCDTYETGVVIRRTAEIAARINSTPIAIYETALLECGLNPFRIRDDKVAAGWIQFTRAGVQGFGVTMPEVIAACRRRDIGFIMDLTEKYLVQKWERAGRPDMRNTIDLYLAVFAPAHIGASPERIVYAGFGNPAYDLNSGLDGWFQDGGKIIRKASECDGKIQVWEIWLCLERRKGLLLE